MATTLEQMEQRIWIIESGVKQKENKEIARADGQGSAVPPADGKPTKDRKDAEDRPKQARDQKGATGVAKPDWAVLATRDITGKTVPTNPPNSIIGLVDSPVTGMSIGPYGDAVFRCQQHPT